MTEPTKKDLASASEDESSDLTAADGLRLLRAFRSIIDPGARELVIELAERLALRCN